MVYIINYLIKLKRPIGVTDDPIEEGKHVSDILLGVNVDHIATLRQARGTSYPDPVLAAGIAELSGADGITIHLREDRRHIIDRDVAVMSQTVQTRLNLEMAVTDEMVAISHQCCRNSALKFFQNRTVT